MNFSIFGGDIDLGAMPDSIKELRIFWESLYDKCPVIALLLILMVPVTLLYIIYTVGSIFKNERSLDKKVVEAMKKSKKRGKKK
ncbi:hypothetical protein RS584_12685 [Enterobacter sp. DTU_2021_1002640_1_SI_PRY_ASU_LCPMC_013]|uniref:hypothetical protein n=1 Tax=Enterobacter TaxID=547 RepID=UPI00076066D3|nr:MULTISPECIES: hypothetical protein [Enterobacter]MBG0552697.1 hypothetical protein [Enterobacter hormaechei]WNU98598.1 hypothetical protein RS584_12685 [Enterobacter sp. DTU_2021_1002640_1_SI_PRY_ASU_LCPMC_013]DAI82888.1 MAG TPA: hypothetical protein [Caudoviricetes sp.]